MHFQAVVLGDCRQLFEVPQLDSAAGRDQIGRLFLDPTAIEHRCLAAPLHRYGRRDRLFTGSSKGDDDYERPVLGLRQRLQADPIVTRVELDKAAIERPRRRAGCPSGHNRESFARQMQSGCCRGGRGQRRKCRRRRGEAGRDGKVAAAVDDG